jgi:hypothetical protein
MLPGLSFSKRYVLFTPVPVVAPSKAWVCGRSPAEIVGSDPPGTWIPVSCECCVSSGRGLCEELVTRLEESYLLRCVVVCDLETSWIWKPWSALGRNATQKINTAFLSYVFVPLRVKQRFWIYSFESEETLFIIFCNFCKESVDFKIGNF